MRRFGTIPGILMIALAAIAPEARAQADCPSKPLRWLVGFAPGASNDIIARVVVHLADLIRQPVVVDDRSGGAGMIAGETVLIKLGKLRLE